MDSKVVSNSADRSQEEDGQGPKGRLEEEEDEDFLLPSSDKIHKLTPGGRAQSLRERKIGEAGERSVRC